MAKEKSNRNKQNAYEQRQRDRGLVKVCTWIPKSEVDLLKAYAGRKTKAHLTAQEKDSE